MSLFKFSGRRPANLGAPNGTLASCPDAPKCVSSQESGGQAIQPLATGGDGAAAFAALLEVIEARDDARLVTQDSRYLHAEFTTPLMGFVDDVECVLSSDGSRIDVRSCSRLGDSDLGANRKRVEALRQALGAKLG